MTEPSPDTPQTSRYLVLTLLFVAYAFNFVDRQIVGILAHPIKASLALSDTQLGMLGGLAFALLYTGAGIPIAWLADRTGRSWVMTAALTIWSAFTALCGFAANFGQLFAARVGVGIGEAGGVAPAYSLISDYFPPRERARALAIYSFGIPVGSAAGIALGGMIASHVNWRVAFIAVGVAGIVLAPIFRAVVKEPKRAPSAAATAAKYSFVAAARALASKPSFWLISFGAGASSVMGYGVLFWMPSFLIRSFGLSLADAAYFYGALLLVAGVLGVWLGGVLADGLGARSRSAFMLIPAASFLAAIPCYWIGLTTPSLSSAFLLLIPPTALGLAWLGPVLAAVQQLAPPEMRSAASASFLFINNAIGLGLGATLIGAISDLLTARFGEEGLRYSIVAGTGFYLLAAALFALAARFIKKDCVA